MTTCESAAGSLPRFVVQKFYATTHNFDLRLEWGGVLVSWAVPEGMPGDTLENRLAGRVEDHGLSHLDVVARTPVEAVPGAKKKSIGDGGTYETEEFGEEEVIVRLRGRRLDGRYAIFRTGGKHWLVHKMKAAHGG